MFATNTYKSALCTTLAEIWGRSIKCERKINGIKDLAHTPEKYSAQKSVQK
jgi:hypothetical protein